MLRVSSTARVIHSKRRKKKKKETTSLTAPIDSASEPIRSKPSSGVTMTRGVCDNRGQHSQAGGLPGSGHFWEGISLEFDDFSPTQPEQKVPLGSVMGFPGAGGFGRNSGWIGLSSLPTRSAAGFLWPGMGC